MRSTPVRPRTIALVLLLALSGIQAAQAYYRPVPGWSERFEYVGAKARLAEIVGLVEQSNAPNLVGHGRWESLLGSCRPAIEECTGHRAFADEVNKLLKASGSSHFKYYIDEDWGFWHMRSAFWRDSPDVLVEHIGVFPERIDGRWFVRGVIEGTSAATTGIRIGDEILSVDGDPYTPIESFRGRAGQPTRIRLRRRPGLTYSVNLEPVRGSFYRTLQRAMRESIHVIEHDGFKMAYMHGWTLLGSGKEYGDLLDIQDLADGLLLDYRDGCGGTWHAAARFLLGRRSSPDKPRRNPRWSKPVVILTDVGTRSAKEIVVDAVKRYGRAPLVGAPTPGAVTSVGGVRLTGEDGLILLPGHRFELEGNPTEPDFLVLREIPYCAGADPQLAMAKDVLAGLLASGAIYRAPHTLGQR